jgi:two-component system sensor histidine kinase VicK
MPGTESANSFPYFLQGGGEMGELIRSVDWEKNALGDPENWPSALKHSVGTMLSLSFPMLICWGKDYIQLYNDKFRPINGETKHPQAMGGSARDTYAEIWDSIGPMFEQVMQGQSLGFPDFKVVLHRNGYDEDCYFDFSYSPIKDEQDIINGVLVICVETTERVKAIKELSESNLQQQLLNQEISTANIQSLITRRHLEDSEAKLDQVIDLLPAAITVLIGPDLIIERTNPSNLAYWQKTKEQTFGKRLLDVLPELADQPFPGQLKHVLETGETVIVYEGEVNLELVDGSISTTYVDYSYQPLTDRDGQRIGVLVMSNDVTEKVVSRRMLEASEEELQSMNEELAATNEELSQTVDKLQDSEQQIRGLIENAPFPIALYIGREMRIAQANQAIIEVWGKGPDVIGETYHSLLPELEAQDIYAILDDVYTTGTPFNGRNARVDLTINGELRTFYFNYSFTPLFNKDGQVYGILNTAADVTDLVLAKQMVEQSEENFRNMIIQAPVAMCLLSGPEHIIDLANTAMLEIWGKPVAEVMNKPVWDALPDAKEQGLEAIMSAVYQTGEPFVANEQPVSLIRFGEPDIVYQNFVYQPYYDSEGNILGVLAISVDVTEQVLARQKIELSEAELQITKKQLEAELEADKQLQQQKDGFIGMASHELKTPLTSLSAIIQVANAKLKNSEDAFLRGAMEKASTQVKRMNNLINGFLNISRLESGKILIDKSDVDLDVLIKEIVAEFELTVSTHTFKLDLCESVVVHADRDKIGSVISNLLSNAVKYSPKGKHIKIKCGVKENKVQVSITDEGMGIKAQDLTKVFDRYFRVETNHTQHIAGFGIGLYLSAEIIHQHEGTIGVKSESGVGSTFYFDLPLA